MNMFQVGAQIGTGKDKKFEYEDIIAKDRDTAMMLMFRRHPAAHKSFIVRRVPMGGL